jgi:heterodisulfide reductase subunit A-like polyferredoxin
LEAGNEILSSKGIFLSGTVRGPKDIAQSITQSYRAAEEIAAYLKARPL